MAVLDGDQLQSERVAHTARAGFISAVLAVLLSLAAVAAALVLAPQAPPVVRDVELVSLLRFMALVKGLMVGTALALILWRSHWPLSTGTAMAYGLACSVASLAVALIAQLAWVGPAALAFHIAELGFLFTAWRDGRSVAGGAIGSGRRHRPQR